MKLTGLLVLAAAMAAMPPAQAADREDGTQEAPAPAAGKTPAMSDIPVMKEQGKRMAELMEQLSRESDPEIRRRLMAEATCPQ